jgi:1-phosphatidylinositol phosphodiesterase
VSTFITQTSWMRDIPDETPVTALSIPGTHNSACIGGPLGFGQTQNLDLSHQLIAGIRFIDLRLAHYQDNLFVHHDVVHMEKCYADVLEICSDFLRQFPSEAIFMSVKDEDRVDSGLGRLAPSEVFGKNRGDPASWAIRSDSFEEVFKAKTWQHVDDASLFYNFASPLPGDGSEATAPALTSDTTLEDIRGKIVLLRRFEGSDDVGLDLTYWPENQTFRSAAIPVHDIHDRYQGLEDEEKYELVVAHLEEAKKGDLKDLYITFSSAVGLKAHGYAEVINPHLNDYLVESSKGRVGIVAMDYFEEPPELVSNVIKMN